MMDFSIEAKCISVQSSTIRYFSLHSRLNHSFEQTAKSPKQAPDAILRWLPSFQNQYKAVVFQSAVNFVGLSSKVIMSSSRSDVILPLYTFWCSACILLFISLIGVLSSSRVKKSTINYFNSIFGTNSQRENPSASSFHRQLVGVLSRCLSFDITPHVTTLFVT